MLRSSLRSSVSPRILPRLHLPLPRLALCLDCEEAFEIAGACPACGSETWLPVANFLERGARTRARRRAEDGDGPRYVLVIARERTDLYEALRVAFAGQHVIRLVLDRRKGDRRQLSSHAGPERRRRDRRRRADVERQLRSHGCALVTYSPDTVRRFAAS
jgi:hypothetical protein